MTARDAPQPLINSHSIADLHAARSRFDPMTASLQSPMTDSPSQEIQNRLRQFAVATQQQQQRPLNVAMPTTTPINSQLGFLSNTAVAGPVTNGENTANIFNVMQVRIF